MQSRPRSNEYRTTTVCIDSYDEGVLSGRFYHAYREGSQTFHSITQLLIKMEQTLDAMSFPQSFHSMRSFLPPAQQQIDHSADEMFPQGKLATFAVKVLFRQNASWQGSVSWLEGIQEESFRSALELILLMDSALNGNDERESEKTTDHVTDESLFSQQ